MQQQEWCAGSTQMNHGNNVQSKVALGKIKKRHGFNKTLLKKL